VAIPVLSSIPLLGPALFDQSILVYLMYVLVPIVFFVVFRTPFGLRCAAPGRFPRLWTPRAST
jgi:simple sugar transport system permease protein